LSNLTPKFIYFDLDDTLLDHKKAEQKGLADVYQHFDVFTDISLKTLLNVYHLINKGLWEEYGRGKIDRFILQRQRFEETLSRLGIDTALHEQIGNSYMDNYRNHWEWIDGAKEAYDAIRGKYPTGIITNGFAETQWMKIDQFGFKETSSQIVISEEVGVMKPHPKIFDYSTQLVGVERSEILYVGDSLTSDIMGGKEAGWKVAWYTNDPVDEEYIIADLIFDDFRTLLFKLGL
jgi:putative hydrolase of the HAD superfamily